MTYLLLVIGLWLVLSLGSLVTLFAVSYRSFPACSCGRHGLEDGSSITTYLMDEPYYVHEQWRCYPVTEEVV